MPKTIDKIWVIVAPNGKGFIYAKPATSAREAWQNALHAVRDIIGWDADSLQAKGYRAKKVSIVL